MYKLTEGMKMLVLLAIYIPLEVQDMVVYLFYQMEYTRILNIDNEILPSLC